LRSQRLLEQACPRLGGALRGIRGLATRDDFLRALEEPCSHSIAVFASLAATETDWYCDFLFSSSSRLSVAAA
jgi:hypothetical protein